MTTTTDHPVTLLRESFADLNARNIDRLLSKMADDFVINLAGAPGPRYGKEAWRENIDIVFGAFPDLRAEIMDCFGDGDRVAVRLIFHGTHTGEFLGIPATGRTVSYDSTELYRVVDGVIMEEWICTDLAGLMRQLTSE
ncbi:ester cyclase [Microlunatus speluncae]|uniref:ester cyclase n=1 Tax=Microlunatus speluncae TaxID=2594267 RepID=UPI00126658BE|nr:ester cyclase [Microlunatus speluncae]